MTAPMNFCVHLTQDWPCVWEISGNLSFHCNFILLSSNIQFAMFIKNIVFRLHDKMWQYARMPVFTTMRIRKMFQLKFSLQLDTFSTNFQVAVFTWLFRLHDKLKQFAGSSGGYCNFKYVIGKAASLALN